MREGVIFLLLEPWEGGLGAKAVGAGDDGTKIREVHQDKFRPFRSFACG